MSAIHSAGLIFCAPPLPLRCLGRETKQPRLDKTRPKKRKSVLYSFPKARVYSYIYPDLFLFQSLPHFIRFHCFGPIFVRYFMVSLVFLCESPLFRVGFCSSVTGNLRLSDCLATVYLLCLPVISKRPLKWFCLCHSPPRFL